jgi:hypothetical protein
MDSSHAKSSSNWQTWKYAPCWTAQQRLSGKGLVENAGANLHAKSMS